MAKAAAHPAPGICTAYMTKEGILFKNSLSVIYHWTGVMTRSHAHRPGDLSFHFDIEIDLT